jgi:hypothetical protein
MINEPIRPDNENELLNELLYEEINYQITVKKRFTESECWKK